jgi:hypothetical protein
VWDCVGAAVGGAGAGNLSRLTGWEDDKVSGLGGSPRGRQGGAGYGHDGYRGGSKSGTCIITGDARKGGVEEVGHRKDASAREAYGKVLLRSGRLGVGWGRRRCCPRALY